MRKKRRQGDIQDCAKGSILEKSVNGDVINSTRACKKLNKLKRENRCIPKEHNEFEVPMVYLNVGGQQTTEHNSSIFCKLYKASVL